MAKGKILTLKKRLGTQTDLGLIKDTKNGAEHYFEAKSGTYTAGMVVEYGASVSASVGRKGPDGKPLVAIK